MADLAAVERVRQLRLRREGIIFDVCGRCGNKCCAQMTMMGSQDLRLLLRDMLLDEEFALQVRAGLRERARELEADLHALERTAEQLRAAGAERDYPAEMASLGEGLERWRQFLDFLRSDFPLEYDQLTPLLQFAAVRSDVLNSLLRLPAGAQTLVRLSLGRASFRLAGPRRFAPPECLFYLSSVGCIAGEAKPAKCANFFCTGDPNVLGELRQQMSFDEFVLSYFAVTDITRLVQALRLEHALGDEFVRPKVVLGASEDELRELEAVLTEVGCRPRVEHLHELSAQQVQQLEPELMRLRPPRALTHVCAALGGQALYELALVLDRVRLEDKHPPYLLAVGALQPEPQPHPLWAEGMMAQPLGALDMYALEPAPA